jgi:hypothetical protein
MREEEGCYGGEVFAWCFVELEGQRLEVALARWGVGGVGDLKRKLDCVIRREMQYQCCHSEVA